MSEQDICDFAGNKGSSGITLEDLYSYAARQSWSIGYALRRLRDQDSSTEEQQRAILGIENDTDWFYLQGRPIPPFSSFDRKIDFIAQKYHVVHSEALKRLLRQAKTILNLENCYLDNYEDNIKDCWCL